MISTSTTVGSTWEQITAELDISLGGQDNITTDNDSLLNASWLTTEDVLYSPPSPTYNAIITTILALLAGVTSLCTTVGNIMVVISFVLERSIRQPANYLIASLAVTDILIGSLSMPLYTLYLLKSYWPLGQITCDLWLSLDYTVCLVSQYTVFLITLDRFCSVKVPARYRNWRTKNKIKIMIAITWLVPALIFFTSIIGWHHFVQTKPKQGDCVAMFQNDPLFSAILVISYYWVPLIVMIGFYVGIYKVAWNLHLKAKQKKQRIQKATQNGVSNKSSNEKAHDSGYNTPKFTSLPTSSETAENDTEELCSEQTKFILQKDNNNTTKDSPSILQVKGGCDSVSVQNGDNASLRAESTSLRAESPIWKPRTSLPNASIHWDAFSGHTHHTVDKKALDSECASMVSRSPRSPHRQPSRVSDNYDSGSDISDADAAKPKVIHHLTILFNNLTQQKKDRETSARSKSKSENRAKKALRTITFILGAFVICWTPYHVLVLVASFCKGDGCVNVKLYEFSYWLCYMNSPINPFCYALANQQFKKAFIKILKGHYIKEWWQNRK